VFVYSTPKRHAKSLARSPPVQTPALLLCEGIPRSAKRVYQDLGHAVETVSSRHCPFVLRRPPAVHRIHSVSSSFASRGTSGRIRILVVVSLLLTPSCARLLYTWPSCVCVSHSFQCAVSQLTRCTVCVHRQLCQSPVPVSLQGHSL
jgi:hypothetical protein